MMAQKVPTAANTKLKILFSGRFSRCLDELSDEEKHHHAHDLPNPEDHHACDNERQYSSLLEVAIASSLTSRCKFLFQELPLV